MRKLNYEKDRSREVMRASADLEFTVTSELPSRPVCSNRTSSGRLRFQGRCHYNQLAVAVQTEEVRGSV